MHGIANNKGECGQGLSTDSQCIDHELHNLLYYIIYYHYHHDTCKIKHIRVHILHVYIIAFHAVGDHIISSIAMITIIIIIL